MSVNIDAELGVISTGVYGKDIRRAIHDALSKLADAINQEGGGPEAVKVFHCPTHEHYRNYIMNDDIDEMDVVLIDSDHAIMSNVQYDDQGHFITHTDPDSHQEYIGELYGYLHVNDDPPPNEE